MIHSKARCSNWLAFGFRLAAALLCLQAASTSILAQFGCHCCGFRSHYSDTDYPMDLNSDQFPDCSLRVVESGSALSCGPWTSWTRSVQVRSGRYTEFLVQEDTGKLMVLTLGDTISAPAPVGASWRRVDLPLMNNFVVSAAPGTTNQLSGFIADRTNVFLGLRFRDAEGIHFGWLKLALMNSHPLPYLENTFTVAPVDSGFQPVPGQDLKVGSKPTKPAADPGTKTTYTAVALSRQFDARIRRFEWTNILSLAGGHDIHLELDDAVSLLVKNPEGAASNPQPVELQPFRRLWTSPAPGQSWVRSPSILLLRNSVIDDESGSAFSVKSGLLSHGPRILGLQTTNDLGQSQLFSLHLNAEGVPSAISFATGASVVVGSDPSLGADNGGLDLNDDGRIDFMQRSPQSFTQSSGETRQRSYSTIEPLGGNRLVANVQVAAPQHIPFPLVMPHGFAAGVPAPAPDSAGSEWTTNAAHTAFSWSDWVYINFTGMLGSDTGSLAITNGLFIPVEFQGKTGLHYGWLRCFAGQVIDYDFNPEPGHPLAMGERKAMKGPGLRVETRSDGIWLIGEAVSPLWRPARRGVLAGALPWSEPFVPNWSWFAESRWRFEQRLSPTGSAAFFRLGISGLLD